MDTGVCLALGMSRDGRSDDAVSEFGTRYPQRLGLWSSAELIGT